jgi:hypothetical protein
VNHHPSSSPIASIEVRKYCRCGKEYIFGEIFIFFENAFCSSPQT